MNEYNDKILVLCKVEDIEKEIEVVYDFIIRIMDTKVEIIKLIMFFIIIEISFLFFNLAMFFIKLSFFFLNVVIIFFIKLSFFFSDVVIMFFIRIIVFFFKCRDNDCYYFFDFKFFCCYRFKFVVDYMV